MDDDYPKSLLAQGANIGVNGVKLSVPVIDHQEPLRSPQNVELGYHATVGPSKGANTGVDPHILKRSSDVPNHRLKIRVGFPVMLMRNIDQTNGLCNGTRLTVTHLGKSTIVATVITGKRVGTRVFIPRMNLISSDPGLPFKFKRKQFSLTLCFAMTINKSQGQSLS
ncbi:PIF1-like helicase [Medicago truncatula]|uniref:PIF1-like helicase n=1 Tax=Medicago truncatula TaxID=3880 RepID=A0A072TIG4_MEDTR|nr:PIF1-like helicase [Medicago truncatula]